MLIWVHRALLLLATCALGLASLYATRAVTGKPHRARRATRAAIVLFVLLAADAGGRIPVMLADAERAGSVSGMTWAIADLVMRHALPILLWGLALLGRWRGWLADTVFAAAVLIAAGVTVVLYLVPLPGRGWPF